VRRLRLVVIGALIAVVLVSAARVDASGPVCEYGSGQCGSVGPPPVTAVRELPTTTTTAPVEADLPFTGGDLVATAAIGVGTVVIGTGLSLFRRRRR
jgi:hypothetical protein